MIASTMPIALSLVAMIYGLTTHRLGRRWVSYTLMLVAAYVCLRSHTVHFASIGIEVASVGLALTSLDPLRFVRTAKAKTAENA